jgi:aminoglycoside 2'-N-acetyltransferase I
MSEVVNRPGSDLTFEVVAGADLSPARRAALVALCNRAYDEDIEPLLATYTDPVHVIGHFGDKMVSHALWCTRWLSCDNGPLMRTAFVELVATEPLFEGKGYATQIMSRVASEIADFELGALWPNYPEWYGRLGWQIWRGPLFIRTEEGLLPTPEDIVMVMLLSKTPALNLDGSLSAEWREGELW